MTTLTVRAHGPVNAASAWERYADPSLWSQWAPQITGVDTAAARIAPGVTGTVHGIGGVRVRFVVDEVDESARTWSWRARLGPIRLALVHGVTERDAGCRTWLRVSGPLPVVIAYVPVAGLALRRLVRP